MLECRLILVLKLSFGHRSRDGFNYRNELSKAFQIKYGGAVEINHRTKNQRVRESIGGWTSASSHRKLYLCRERKQLMARGAEKWAAKLSGDARKKAIDAQKPQMVRLESIATSELVQIEKEIKQICQGESTIRLPYYIIFAKELYRIMQYHTAQTLVDEAEILEEKWRTRGLDYELLDAIKMFYIQAYKNIQHFKLDVSGLDGPHVLA